MGWVLGGARRRLVPALTAVATLAGVVSLIPGGLAPAAPAAAVPAAASCHTLGVPTGPTYILAPTDYLTTPTMSTPLDNPAVGSLGPVWSPTGDRYAWIDVPASASTVRVVRVADGGSDFEATGQAVDDVAFSPDGGRLAWSGADGVHVHDLTAGTQVDDPTAGRDLHWAPDGAHLAWTSVGSTAGTTTYQLRVLDTATGTTHDGDALAAPEALPATTPAVGWSPDGVHLYEVGPAAGGGLTISTFDVTTSTGTAVATVTTLPSVPRRPAVRWAPGGSRLAYAASGVGLHTVSADGTGDVAVSTSALDFDWSSSVALAFAADQQIVVSAADGTNAVTISTAAGAGGHHAPVFSPDGTWVAWSSAPSSAATNVWAAKADGTQVHPLDVPNPAFGGEAPTDGGLPAWSHDGTRVAWSLTYGYLGYGIGDGGISWLDGSRPPAQGLHLDRSITWTDDDTQLASIFVSLPGGVPGPGPGVHDAVAIVDGDGKGATVHDYGGGPWQPPLDLRWRPGTADAGNLAVAITADVPAVGQPTTVHVTVTNTGGCATNGATVAVDLPAGLAASSTSLSFGPLAGGASSSKAVQVTIPAGQVGRPTVAVNLATTIGNSDPADDHASVVLPPPSPTPCNVLAVPARGPANSVAGDDVAGAYLVTPTTAQDPDGTTATDLPPRGGPAWHPDGTRYAWFTPAVPYGTAGVDTTVRVTRLADHGTDLEVTSPSVGDVAFSPDGTRLAWLAGDGAHVRDLTTQAQQDDPAPGWAGLRWSPDGRYLAWPTGGPTGPYSLHVLDTTTNTGTTGAPLAAQFGQLTIEPDPGLGWSPDSRHLYALVNNGGVWRLEIDDAASGTAVDVGPSPVGKKAWAPDGSRLAFVDDAFELHTVLPDGTGDARITNLVPFDPGPQGPGPLTFDWSATGGALAFSEPLSLTEQQVVVAAPDGTGRVIVSSGAPPGVHELPAFSPDGAQVAWVTATSTTANHVWVAHADGTGVHSVDDASPLRPGLESLQPWSATVPPVWSHDGSRVAWSLDYGQLYLDVIPYGVVGGISWVDGSRPRVTGLHLARGSVWSPDDRQLASRYDFFPYSDTVPNLMSHLSVVTVDGDGRGETHRDFGTGPGWLQPTDLRWRPAVTEPAGNLALSLSATPTVATTNQVVTVDVTVTNTGACPVNGAAVHLELPAGGQSATDPIKVGALAPGASQTVGVPVQFAQGLEPNGPGVDITAHLLDASDNASTADDTATVHVDADPNTPLPPKDGAFHPVAPFRLVDSRVGLGVPSAVGAGLPGVRTATVAGVGPIRSTVRAVALNVTVTNPDQASYLTAYPTGTTPPLAANLVFAPGQTVPNHVTVPVGADGTISLFNQQGSTDVVIDVLGWYDDGYNADQTGLPSPDLGDTFTAMPPARVLDSRSGAGFIGALGAGPAGSNTIDEADLTAALGTVPGDLDAVVMNVTVTGGSLPSYLQVTPDDGVAPTTANLLFAPGQTVSNLVTVKVDAATKGIRFTNQQGNVDVVADLVGIYRANGTGARFHPVTPVRALDSRTTTGGWASAPLGENQARTLDLATGPATVPPAARAVVGNLTATQGTAATYLTGSPTPGTVPAPTANLLVAPDQTIPNAILTGVGTGATIDLYNQHGSQHVILDVAGWFVPGPG